MNANDLTLMVKQAKEEQLLFATVDVDDLLQSLEKESHEYLENKSFKTIAEDIINELYSVSISTNEIPILCNKLNEYFVIKNIYDFRKSHFIRYIKKGESKLHNGGILVNVYKSEKGVIYVKLLIFGNRFITVRLEEYIFFQKLTPDEKIILLSFDYIERLYESSKPTVSPDASSLFPFLERPT